MRVAVYAFGKLKTPGLREASDYYKKLTQSWIPIEEIELKPLSVPDKQPQTRLQIQTKEGEILLSRLNPSKNDLGGRHLVYLLDETGKTKTTAEWAQDLRIWENTSIQRVSFCIGSSLGFSTEVRQLAKGCISLGSQTLPHELCRVVLLEQLYRAQSVVRGHPYHNSGS